MSPATFLHYSYCSVLAKNSQFYWRGANNAMPGNIYIKYMFTCRNSRMVKVWNYKISYVHIYVMRVGWRKKTFNYLSRVYAIRAFYICKTPSYSRIKLIFESPPPPPFIALLVSFSFKAYLLVCMYVHSTTIVYYKIDTFIT